MRPNDDGGLVQAESMLLSEEAVATADGDNPADVDSFGDGECRLGLG